MWAGRGGGGARSDRKGHGKEGASQLRRRWPLLLCSRGQTEGELTDRPKSRLFSFFFCPAARSRGCRLYACKRVLLARLGRRPKRCIGIARGGAPREGRNARRGVLRRRRRCFYCAAAPLAATRSVLTLAYQGPAGALGVVADCWEMRRPPPPLLACMPLYAATMKTAALLASAEGRREGGNGSTRNVLWFHKAHYRTGAASSGQERC